MRRLIHLRLSPNPPYSEHQSVNVRERDQARHNSDYRCFCKSKKGRQMTRFEGDPKRVGAMSQKAPFGRGEYGFWCQSCGNPGLVRREVGRKAIVCSDGRTRYYPVSVVLVDMFAEHLGGIRDPDAYKWLRPLTERRDEE